MLTRIYLARVTLNVANLSSIYMEVYMESKVLCGKF